MESIKINNRSFTNIISCSCWLWAFLTPNFLLEETLTLLFLSLLARTDMKSVLKVLGWFGVVIQIYPLDTLVTFRQNHLRKALYAVNLATQTILYVVPVLVHLDAYLNFSNLKKYYLHLSGNIEVGLWFIGSVASYSIIRICSMTLRQHLADLYESVASEYPGLWIIWGQNKFLFGFSVILSTLWFLNCIDGIIRYYLRISWSPKCDFMLLPCDELLTKSVSIICELLVVVSVFYAWSWVLLYGMTLVTRLDQFSKRCQVLASHDWSMNLAIEQFPIDEPATKDLLHEFRCIKGDYERYRRVGGAYALGIMVHLVVQVTVFLSSGFAHGVAVADWWDLFAGYNLILCFVSAITLLYLGENMVQSVRRHNFLMHELQAATVLRRDDKSGAVLRWLENWQWKFSALGLFYIECRSLTGVASIVSTYFIFLFQLKAAELDRHARNCTV